MKHRCHFLLLLWPLMAAPALCQVKPCSDGPSAVGDDAAAAAAAAAGETVDDATFPRGVDRCPALPAASGFAWSYHDGPDFGVCYGVKSGEDKSNFGIYLGNFPSFDPKHAVAIGPGVVGGHAVTWYRHQPPAASAAFSRQTLVLFCQDPGYVEAAHVWVNGDSQQSLDDSLSVLRRMTFKR